MFNSTKGPARERIDSQELERLRQAGTVISDPRRRRPLYFDGRFLAARDLIREQNYMLTRQADFGKSIGQGVVQGLMVNPGKTSTSLTIEPGHGLTHSGEIVVLSTLLTVALDNLSDTQRLNRAFGLSRIPRSPTRTRTGLYVLALRPVEFTANPIVSYPTTVDGQRSVEDGDIVEGVAVTLIPYPDEGTPREFAYRRSQAAHNMFILESSQGIPSMALPLAIVALNRNIIQWIDPYLVRRDVHAVRHQGFTLGQGSRGIREAHVLQYQYHLQDMVDKEANTGKGLTASHHFLALPPVGPFPRAGINPVNLTQTFFPPEIDVEVSVVPNDEMSAIIEESLLLPPIDLTIESDQLESTSVLILVPIPRPEVRRLFTQLQRLETLPPQSTSEGDMTTTKPIPPKSSSPLIRPLALAAPGLLAKRKPLEVLRNLKPPSTPRPAVNADTIIDSEWKKILAQAQELWYVRRRNFSPKAEVVGASIRVFGDELDRERELATRLSDADLLQRFGNLKRRGSAEADAEMVSTIVADKFSISPTLMDGVLREFEELDRVDQVSVLKVSERFADPRIGEGVRRLEQVNPSLKSPVISQNLALSGAIPELDRLGRIIDETKLAALSRTLEEESSRSDTESPTRIAAIIKNELQKLEKGTPA